MYQIIMLYALKLNNAICQLYLAKIGGGINTHRDPCVPPPHTHTTDRELIEQKEDSRMWPVPVKSQNDPCLCPSFPSMNRGFRLTVSLALNCELQWGSAIKKIIKP